MPAMRDGFAGGAGEGVHLVGVALGGEVGVGGGALEGVLGGGAA